MRRLLLLFIALLSVTAVKADEKKKAVKPKISKEIEWISFEEAEKRMKTEPRKVWIDMYTDWCGWCKVLDKKVFTNPDVINYMNNKYYAIKFNAERRDSFDFAGKRWGFMPESKANNLAVQLTGGNLSYPTTILMTENFQNPSAIMGYKPVEEVESFMKYLGEDIYKNTKYEDYMKTFKPQWKEIITPETNAPMGGH
jgi:thioredoxin-related protein